jgi:hypothetical protein
MKTKSKFKYTLLKTLSCILFFICLSGCNQSFKSPELDATGASYTHTYNWYYDGQEYQLTITTPVTTYLHYLLKPHVPIEEWNTLVKEDPEFPYLASLDQGLYSAVANRHLNNQEFAQFVLSFVQNMSYGIHYEPFQIESPKYPLVSLIDGEKDCKDGSLLYAAIMSSMHRGYNMKLFALPGHMAVGISGFPDKQPFYKENGTIFAYAETTCPIALGDLPTGIGSFQLRHVFPINN